MMDRSGEAREGRNYRVAGARVKESGCQNEIGGDRGVVRPRAKIVMRIEERVILAGPARDDEADIGGSLSGEPVQILERR